MLRLLGVTVVVVIWAEAAPWGMLVGAILFLALFLGEPTLFTDRGLESNDKHLIDGGGSSLSTIPLPNAVYCVNCDLITNSPHDACCVCGSHSVVAVSRMWQLTSAKAASDAARYKVSFTVDVRGIPANGLNESTKLISRLAELGGDVKTLHIKVDPVFGSDAIPIDAKTDMANPVKRTATSTWQQVRRQAS